MKKVLIWICPLLLLGTAARAAPVCTTNTLDMFLAAGVTGCTVNDVLFKSFGFDAISSGGAAVIGPSAIKVTPITDAASPGLSFLGPFAAGAGQGLDVAISFVVAASAISGDTLAMTGFGASGDGSVRVAESLCRGGAFAANGTCSGPVSSLEVFRNSAGLKASDTASFATVATLGVVKNVIVSGGVSGDAGVSFVINTVPGGGGAGPGGGPEAVPEPASFFLLGSGLILTGLLLRRRVRKA